MGKGHSNYKYRKKYKLNYDMGIKGNKPEII